MQHRCTKPWVTGNSNVVCKKKMDGGLLPSYNNGDDDNSVDVDVNYVSWSVKTAH